MDDFEGPYSDEFKPVSYEAEIQKLKCENFQLRLNCYNYECTLNNIQCGPKDNALLILQDSYDLIVKNCNTLENAMRSLQNENLDLKERLDEYIYLEEEKSKLSVQDVETQISFPFKRYEDLEDKHKRSVDEFSKEIIELEKKNAQLHYSLEESKLLNIKCDTTDAYCITDQDMYTSVVFDELSCFNDSTAPNSVPVEQSTLESIMKNTICKINDFLINYENGETKLRALENDITSTLQYDINNDVLTDDNYKCCLFNEEGITLRTDPIYGLIEKCYGQLIKIDFEKINTFLSESEEESNESNEVLLENPNTLIINSILLKLNKKSEEIINKNRKIKNNQKWNVHISMLDSKNKTKNLKLDIIEEISEYIKTISFLSSRMMEILPNINVTFSKTIESRKTNENLPTNEKSSFISDSTAILYHYKNKRLFLDSYDLLLDSASNCISALNKEKIFLNSSSELVAEIEKENCSLDLIVEVINDSTMEEENTEIFKLESNKETMTEYITPNHVGSQTFIKPQVKVPNLSIHKICYEIDQDSQSSSPRSTDTYTIGDNHSKLMRKQRANTGGCGDVISEITITNSDGIFKSVKESTFIEAYEYQNDPRNLRRCASLELVAKNDIFNSKENLLSLSKDDLNVLSVTPRTWSVNSTQNIDCSTNIPEITKKCNFSIDKLSQNLSEITKIKITKLLCFYNFHKMIENIKKKDNFLIGMFESINAQSVEENPKNSEMFEEAEANIKNWGNKVKIFKEKVKKCEDNLELISEEDLFQQLFNEIESKLRNFISEENSKIVNEELENVQCFTTDDLEEDNADIEDLYYYTLESVHLYRFNDKYKNDENDENVKKKYQNTLQENIALLESVQKLKNESQTLTFTFTNERYLLQKEIENIKSEKYNLKNLLEKNVENGKKQLKDAMNEINLLVQSNINLKEEIKGLTEKHKDLKNSYDLMENNLHLEKEIEERNKNSLEDNLRKLIEMELKNNFLEKESSIVKEHEKQLLTDLTLSKNTMQNDKDNINELLSELNLFKIKVSEQKNQIIEMENKQLKDNNIYENTLKEIMKKLEEKKIKVNILEKEIENAKMALCTESSNFRELLIKLEFTEEELQNIQSKLNFKTKELNLLKLKKESFYEYKPYMDLVKDKFKYFKKELTEIIKEFDLKLSNNSVKLEFNEENLYKEDYIEEMKIICVDIEILTEMLRNYIISFLGEVKSVVETREKFVQVNLINEINDQSLKDVSDSISTKYPIPAPRLHSHHSKGTFESEEYCRNDLKSHTLKRNIAECKMNERSHIEDNDDTSQGFDHGLMSLENESHFTNRFIINDSRNFEKLIDTNQYLTNNLMKTTKKIFVLQKKAEQLKLELNQCQMEKHNISVELGEKYEKLLNIQSELENIKSKTKILVHVEVMTQTISGNKIQKEHTILEDNHNNKDHIRCQTTTDSEDKEELTSRISQNTPNKYEHVSPPPLSHNPSNNYPIVPSPYNDLDDVTRTMIRCLTTLSDVQDSLVNPSLVEDTSKLVPVKDSSVLIEQESLVRVYIIEENKYQIIRHIIIKMKEHLKPSDETKSLEHSQISQLQKLLKKLHNIFANSVIIRELSSTSSKNLFENKSALNTLVLESSDDCLRSNPLEVTERVQNDIVRLQQRLERYQRRYKSLKNAVMTNKYKFNNEV